MRIALLHPTYWPEVRRGSERLVHDAAVALAEAGHDVTLLTTHRRGRSVTVQEGVRIVRSYRPPTRLMHRRAYEYHLTVVPSAVIELVTGEYDVAHAFFLVDAWAALEARRFGGPPLVLSFNGIADRRFLVARRYRLPMLERIAREAEEIAVLSEAAREPFERYLLRRPQVIPGGVRAADFAGPADRAAAPTLICAATPNDERKRVPLLLRAFTHLRARRPEARLVLAGQADLNLPPLDDRLPEGATWTEPSDTAALGSAYASAWASVLPSVNEAFGLVLLESLAAGTPVVAGRSGACPELVNGDDAVSRLFEPDDELDLARALEEALGLAEDPATAAACQQHAQRYDWSRLLPCYERVYEAALAGSRG